MNEGRFELFERIHGLSAEMRRRLAEINEARPSKTEVIFNTSAGQSPYIFNFSLPGYEGAVLMRMLADKGIIVGTGSACSAESKFPSRILTAMGRSDQQAFGALRVSFGFQNSIEEIDVFIRQLLTIVNEY